MKVYTLRIGIDTSKDEVEFIEETIEEDTPVYTINGIDLRDILDPLEMQILMADYDITIGIA